MNAIYKIYLDSVKILWKRKLLYLIPLAGFFLYVFEYRANKYHPGLYSSIFELLVMGIDVVIELLILLTIFQENDAYPPTVSRWNGIKKYFWRTVGINFASFLVVLIALSPLCFFLYLLALDEFNNIFSVLYVFVFIVFSVLFFGVNSLGIRVLVSQDKKIMKSMWTGFQDLNVNRSYYFPFLTVLFLISFLPSFIVNVISLIQTGLTMYSVPFIPNEIFRNNSLLVYASVPGSYTILRIYNLIISPITAAAITLAYLRCPRTANFPIQLSETTTNS